MSDLVGYPEARFAHNEAQLKLFLSPLSVASKFGPYVTNGRSNHNILDELILILRGIRIFFSFLFHFSMKYM